VRISWRRWTEEEEEDREKNGKKTKVFPFHCHACTAQKTTPQKQSSSDLRLK
jgi:hypothetical protein